LRSHTLLTLIYMPLEKASSTPSPANPAYETKSRVSLTAGCVRQVLLDHQYRRCGREPGRCQMPQLRATTVQNQDELSDEGGEESH
ncbi:unnamed protein product, partial [Musa hybrid cultivar]